ncbi:MAG: MBL fold metallo-hydrolase [Planctomycetota bacterium]|jgi:phosphoribosyl 1,2-cyclic phosphodiesterase|nr:MBL fold metallo-hydrolase [Planctomycetota bacterium]
MTASEPTITIVFHGVRGSYPVPGPTTLVYGGNTTSQEIRVGGRLLIFDAGTGIIKLGQRLARPKKPLEFAMFFSHNHHDHTSGLLYFKPAYLKTTKAYIYGPVDEGGDILGALSELSNPPAHPVALRNMGMNFTCDNFENGMAVRWAPGKKAPELLGKAARLHAGDVVVKALRNPKHPAEGVLNFRLEYRGRSYVYATDVEGDAENGDPLLARFANGADLLAHDGQHDAHEYNERRRGWGHSTPEMAVKTARMAGVRKLAIIHHEPAYGDAKLARMERETKKLFQNSFFAREGRKVHIP